MYLVELVQFNSIAKTKKRTADYDEANDAFVAMKREAFKELRMFKIDSGDIRVLLKYVIKGRNNTLSHI